MSIALINKQLLTWSLSLDIKGRETKEFTQEMIERLEEFNVIKDDITIDFISLNSLYDFYGKKFDETSFFKRYKEFYDFIETIRTPGTGLNEYIKQIQ